MSESRLSSFDHQKLQSTFLPTSKPPPRPSCQIVVIKPTRSSENHIAFLDDLFCYLGNMFLSKQTGRVAYCRCFRLFSFLRYWVSDNLCFALFVWALAWLFCSIKCDFILKFLLY